MNDSYNQFSCFGDFISNFIETSSDTVHLKDAETGKYINGNLRMLEIVGLNKNEEIISLTVDDIMAESGPLKGNFGHISMDWRQRQTQKFKKLDYQVKVSNRCIELQHIFFTHKGHIIVESTRRFPVTDLNRKRVIATFSISKDITLQHSLFGLLKLYQDYYSESQAIKRLLNFLAIDAYFLAQPTYTEIKILFAMRQNAHRKYVANFLHLSADTVASHIYHIRKNKLKVPDLDSLLIQIRRIPINESSLYEYT